MEIGVGGGPINTVYLINSLLFLLIKKVVINHEDRCPHMFMLVDSKKPLQEIFCPELLFRPPNSAGISCNGPPKKAMADGNQA